MGYPLRHGNTQVLEINSPRSALVRKELEATLIDDADQASIFFDPGQSALADNLERPMHLNIRFHAAGKLSKGPRARTRQTVRLLPLVLIWIQTWVYRSNR
jgi:hypothetical protein